MAGDDLWLDVERLRPWVVPVSTDGCSHVEPAAVVTLSGLANSQLITLGASPPPGKVDKPYQSPMGAPGSCSVIVTSPTGEVSELAQVTADSYRDDHGTFIEVSVRLPSLQPGVAWVQLVSWDDSTEIVAEPVPLLVVASQHQAVLYDIRRTLEKSRPPPCFELALIFEAVHSVLELDDHPVEQLAAIMRMAVTHGWKSVVSAISQKVNSNEKLDQLFQMADEGPMGLVPRAILSGRRTVLATVVRRVRQDPCESRIPPGFTALHWAAALGPADLIESWIRSGWDMVQTSWGSDRAGPGRGVTPKRLRSMFQTDVFAAGHGPVPQPFFWQPPHGRLLLELGEAQHSQNWQMLQDEMYAVNTSAPAQSQDLSSHCSGVTAAAAVITRPSPPDRVAQCFKPLIPSADFGFDGTASGITGDQALFWSMFAIPSLLPLAVLLPGVRSAADLVWTLVLEVCLCASLVYSRVVVMPEVCKRRQALLQSLRQEASDRGAALGNDFVFSDPKIQHEYERYCMTGGSWVWDNLATCAKMVSWWLPPVCIRGEDMAANAWKTVLELAMQWLALVLLRGVLLAVLGPAASRRVNAVLGPLYNGLLVIQLRCSELLGMRPALSALELLPELPRVLGSSMVGMAPLNLLLFPATFTIATVAWFAVAFPLLPASLHLLQAAVPLFAWPCIVGSMVLHGCHEWGNNDPLRLVLFHASFSVAVVVLNLSLSCYVWRRRERQQIVGFLKSGRILKQQHHGAGAK